MEQTPQPVQQPEQPKPATEKKTKPETTSYIIYFVASIVVGYISFVLNSSFAAVALAIVGLFVLQKVLAKLLKITQPFKWWLSNGGWIYLFFWFISWIIFLNIFKPL